VESYLLYFDKSSLLLVHATLAFPTTCRANCE